jgi:tRNA threonylcarbamoyladenosine biosynthesis protein TsaB
LENRVLLGIDNSMDFLNAAIFLEGRLVEERHVRYARHPSEIIAREVTRILDDHGLGVRDVGRIIVTLGPGSFTGIRVALAFCKGLSAGGGIPITGISTLDVLASRLSFLEGYRLCPLIDAKKGEVFFALYLVSGGEARRLTEYQSARPEALRAALMTPGLCFGSGVTLCEGVLSEIGGVHVVKHDFSRVCGETLIREGLKKAAGPGENDLNPIYGRCSEAEIKFNVQLL